MSGLVVLKNTSLRWYYRLLMRPSYEKMVIGSLAEDELGMCALP